MQLTGEQIESLIKALQLAYPNRAVFSQMLRVKLEKKLNEISSENDNINEAIFKVFEKAESEGWVAKLLQAARQFNPDNQALKDFEQSVLPQNSNKPLSDKTESKPLCDEIKNFISRGKVDKAIEALLNLSKNTDSNKDVISISSQFRQLEREKTLGIIAASDASVQLAKITYSILNILSEMCE